MERDHRDAVPAHRRDARGGGDDKGIAIAIAVGECVVFIVVFVVVFVSVFVVVIVVDCVGAREGGDVVCGSQRHHPQLSA